MSVYLIFREHKAWKEYAVVGGLYHGAFALIELDSNSKTLPFMYNIPSVVGSVTCLHCEEGSNKIVIGYTSNLARHGYSRQSKSRNSLNQTMGVLC